jgi:transposase-like protein
MYSYADRLRAVELYIRLGNRLNATIRQLGYPTKNALRGWYREYVQHLDLRVQPAARAPKYSEAQRQAALEHFRTDRLGVSRPTLYSWKDQLLGHEA